MVFSSICISMVVIFCRSRRLQQQNGCSVHMDDDDDGYITAVLQV